MSHGGGKAKENDDKKVRTELRHIRRIAFSCPRALLVDCLLRKDARNEELCEKSLTALVRMGLIFGFRLFPLTLRVGCGCGLIRAGRYVIHGPWITTHHPLVGKAWSGHVSLSRLGGAAGDRTVAAMASAAARLLRPYATQVEELRRLRNGGSQTLRVEHVHVNEGGQALIGNVSSER